MQFNTKNEGKWFYFNEEKKEDGGVCLRALTLGEAKNISKACSKKETKFVKKDVYQWQNIDDEKYNTMLYDYCIVDWKNVVVDGKELECTKENKLLLVNNSNDFCQFVLKHLETLSEELAVDEENRVKN